MSDFILIQKRLLKALAQHAPDVNIFRRVLLEKYDPDPENRYKFMLLPSNLAAHPDAYSVSDCAEWELLHIVRTFIEKHCPQLPQEQQMRIIQRLHNKLIGKFTCTVQTLGEILPRVPPNAIGKQTASKGFEPQDVEETIRFIWKQCDEAMRKVIAEEEIEKEKNSGS